jgi:four helix bundle protein
LELADMARRLEELTVWQLADELRGKVHERTSQGSCVRDFRFCEQLRDAASSVTRNIAEGFGRYRHKEFANFLGIARGSAFELSDILRDGVSRRHWSGEQVADLLLLTNRTIGALTSFMRYLQHHPTP